jgi:lambda repressor-like predicted transcriptional regulator
MVTQVNKIYLKVWSKQTMEPIEIKIALLRCGVSQSDIARRCNTAPSTVHLVVAGKSVSKKIQSEISGVIGIPVNEIWPDAEPIKDLG